MLLFNHRRKNKLYGAGEQTWKNVLCLRTHVENVYVRKQSFTFACETRFFLSISVPGLRNTASDKVTIHMQECLQRTKIRTKIANITFN